MHTHFYHWHNRVELKPEITVLQSRWDAAAKFSTELSSDDTCALLRLALFGAVGPEFAKRFTETIVAQEPTFLPEDNLELLRVMATAGLYSKLETGSQEADAVALGFVAAAFQPNSVKPVCKELGIRATEFLASESEKIRPIPSVESHYLSLEKATEAEDWADDPGATELVCKAVLELGATMGRIAEENQFMWWLLSRRSSLLNARRDKLSPKEYALLAGAEAADRVALLPPPASVEALIDEVLSQCAKATNTALPLADYIDAAVVTRLQPAKTSAEVGQLCPLHGLIGLRRGGGKVDGESLEKLGIPAKLKISPSETATQYFRELMFLRALAQLD